MLLLLLSISGSRRFGSKHCCRACSKIRPPSTGWAIQMDRPKQKAVCLVGVDFAKKHLLVEAPSPHGQLDLVYVLEMGPRKGSL